MSSVPVSVGLDYHRSSVQVCVESAEGGVLVNRRCRNSVLDVASAVPPGCVVRAAAIESCCGAADLAEELRDGPGWPVVLAHPGYVSRMRQNPDKSDYSDARMLAELCRVGFVPKVWLAPEWIRELRILVRLRADLVARTRTVKSRILATLRLQRVREPERPGRWTKGWTAWLRTTDAVSAAARFAIDLHLAELDTLRAAREGTERELAARTRDDEVTNLLLQQSGIGPATAWTMRAVIGDFSRFGSGKQLSRFCAVTPRNASSGERQADAGLVRAGDPLLKSVLVEAAHRLRRYDPRWIAFSASMARRGKPTSVIVAAVANRWVRRLYHQLKGVASTPTAA